MAMSRSELVSRLLSELSAARTAIVASYQSLWPAAEEALDSTAPDEREPERADRPRQTGTPDDDDHAADER